MLMQIQISVLISITLNKKWTPFKGGWIWLTLYGSVILTLFSETLSSLLIHFWIYTVNNWLSVWKLKGSLNKNGPG